MLSENTNEFSKKAEKYEFSTIKHFSVMKSLMLKKNFARYARTLFKFLNFMFMFKVWLKKFTKIMQ